MSTVKIEMSLDGAKPRLRYGRAPGDVLIRSEELPDQPQAYRVTVDSDGDGDLMDETPQMLLRGKGIHIRVKRTRPGGRSEFLPYYLTYPIYDGDEDAGVRERLRRFPFGWFPYYRAEGSLRVDSRQVLFAVLDFNGDGIFDRSDLKSQSVGIDLNLDGKILADEWLIGKQVIKLGDKDYLARGIEVDGSTVELVETAVRTARLGETLPEFMVKTLDGKQISSGDLRGKVYVLDFWASWCQPCVEKFPLLKQLHVDFKGKVGIIAISVDEVEQLSASKEIIDKYRFEWPQVLLGQEQTDLVWTMFGGVGENRFGVPLYVLIDGQGVIRYAGNGGDNLAELRAKVVELTSALRD